MKNLLLVIVLIIAFGCKGKEQNRSQDSGGEKSVTTSVANAQSGKSIEADGDKAYTLLKKYCYICHLAPGDEMIAPPMPRVKDHYLPVYPQKDQFVEAIVKWVKNPNEEEALMPGAVRKFECMPPQSHIPVDTIRVIAEYIYDHELEMPQGFANAHGRHGRGRGQGMRRRGGGARKGMAMQKVKVSPTAIKTMDEVKEIIQKFDSDKLEDYNKLGKEIFEKSKVILLDKSNKGETWDILHDYFNSLEQDMHRLMATKDIEEARILKNKLSNKINNFYRRFY